MHILQFSKDHFPLFVNSIVCYTKFLFKVVFLIKSDFIYLQLFIYMCVFIEMLPSKADRAHTLQAQNSTYNKLFPKVWGPWAMKIEGFGTNYFSYFYIFLYFSKISHFLNARY